MRGAPTGNCNLQVGIGSAPMGIPNHYKPPSLRSEAFLCGYKPLSGQKLFFMIDYKRLSEGKLFFLRNDKRQSG